MFTKRATKQPIISVSSRNSDESVTNFWFAVHAMMASRGHRVIGCAQYLLPEDRYPADFSFSKDTNYPDSEYCFLGLISLEDPPKHGVREAIGTLRLAGIKVMVFTGMLFIRGDSLFLPRLFVAPFLYRRSP